MRCFVPKRQIYMNIYVHSVSVGAIDNDRWNILLRVFKKGKTAYMIQCPIINWLCHGVSSINLCWNYEPKMAEGLLTTISIATTWISIFSWCQGPINNKSVPDKEMAWCQTSDKQLRNLDDDPSLMQIYVNIDSYSRCDEGIHVKFE